MLVPYIIKTISVPKQALNIISESLCSFATILLSDIKIAITNESINITAFFVVIHIMVFAAKAIVACPLGTNLLLKSEDCPSPSIFYLFILPAKGIYFAFVS